MIGSVIGIVGSRVRSGSAHALPALGPSMAEFVLAPYLGSLEARRVVRSLDFEALQLRHRHG